MASLIGALGAVGPITTALEQINKVTQEISKQAITKEDSEYYRKWLEVAMIAVQGLEGEYEGILHQAYACNLEDAKQKGELESRINTYLHGESLRPKLKEAIEHLEKGKEILKEHTERLLLLPGTRRTREAALWEYEQHLNQLTGYLGSLGDYTGESAVALDETRLLVAAIQGPQESFHALAAYLQKNRDKSNLFEITGSAASTISGLRAAFR